MVVWDAAGDRTGVMMLEEKLKGDSQSFLRGQKYLMGETHEPMEDAVNCLAHWIFHQSDSAVMLTSIKGSNGVLTDVAFLGDQ